MGISRVTLPAVAAFAAMTPTIGKPLSDVELTLVDGSRVRLADLKGQVVLVNVWRYGACRAGVD